MAIQNRRGSYADFGDGSNLVDGEFGMVQSGDTTTADGTGIYAAPVAGTVHRLLVDDDKTELSGDIAQNAQDIDALNSNLTKNTAFKLVRVSSVETQAISGATIFHYDVNVPTGYTIVAAWDDSYYAGFVAAPIRINQGSGTVRVTMAYYGNITTARAYTCAVLMLPNVSTS